MELREEPGWYGLFTRAQAQGALPNGTRIAKCASEPGDATDDGTSGTVLGSVLDVEGRTFYFVEWAIRPRIVVAVMGHRVKERMTNEQA